MTRSISLNGIWDLVYAEDAPEYYAGPTLSGRIPLEATVPAPVHRVLVDAGLLQDPNVGMNSLAARWVEEQFWVYRRTFAVPADLVGIPAWLTFERLELDAAVYLNGQLLGRHCNAHRPARFRVGPHLREGENLLVVLLESGLHRAVDKPTEPYANDWCARVTKRMWLRRPQYQCGWDWNPRLINVGILGDVALTFSTAPLVEQASVTAVPTDDLGAASFVVRVIVDNPSSEPVRGALGASIREDGRSAQEAIEMQPGRHTYSVQVDVDRPQLWWPVGHGPQALYQVHVALEASGERQSSTLRTGVRRVEIDQSPHPVEGRYFVLRVNSRPIFCKGSNWVPPDTLYSTVDRQRYRELVRLAAEANHNVLRVWGGGTYAHHDLCDACDEAGIMLWHDFPFACAKYPGEDQEFAAEVAAEARHAVAELARHPSLVVWCGNNEVAWGDAEWIWRDKPPIRPHDPIFFGVLPEVVASLSPSTPYWPSSPYSPDGAPPNSPVVGDQHPWTVSIEQPGAADFWHYRSCVDRFPNEGGVIGASSPATLRQFLPEGERHLLSPSWYHHDNPFACTSGRRGDLGRAYQTVRLWTGRDPLAMSLDEYAYYSALLQAEGLTEYILNYRRRMFSSASAIFWMYNDSWPATHGWTIVDYYLRRKLAYHPVRRAFQPVTVALAEEGEYITVYGINDSPWPWSGEVRYGLFGLGGGLPLDERGPATLPANASTPLARFPHSAWEEVGIAKAGAFAILVGDGGAVAQSRLFLARFGDLDFAAPHVSLSRTSDAIILSSDVFAWGVCLDLDGELPLADNCFDLLPGIPYSLPWPAHLGEPRVVRIGNLVGDGGHTPAP